MGIFDRIFGGKAPNPPPNPDSLPQLCYGIAYYLIPQMLFLEPERVIRRFTHPEFPPGPWFYVMGCQLRKIQPVRTTADSFSAHSGTLHPGLDYHIIQYPTPPPIDMSDPNLILAPHFSAIVHSANDNQVRYFILGQRPMGGTTLRSVTADGANANLGEGPEPQLNPFIIALKSRNT